MDRNPLTLRLCDGCKSEMGIGEPCYHCSICNYGDLDYCEPCYSRGRRCGHKMQQITLSVETRPMGGRIGTISCSACTGDIAPGQLLVYCGICNGGDYDLCVSCVQYPKNRCGHKMGVYRSPPQPWNQSQSTQDEQHGAEIDKLSKKFQETQLKDALMSSIVEKKPNIKWDDVAGLEQAKSELQQAICFPLRFPRMFRGNRKPPRAILLYGPPGTGKSYLAKAIATEVDSTLFSISSSDIMSKWQGESEGSVKSLFALAREKKPSIIFVDEFDALCSTREGGPGGNGNEGSARVKTEFLVQMDGLGNDNDGVFVLAATNLPWFLDPAIRRRFQKKIYIPLPDEAARAQLFRIYLGADYGTNFTADSFGQMARRTKGLSGSDIANVVQDALMMPINKVQTATHFRKISCMPKSDTAKAAQGAPMMPKSDFAKALQALMMPNKEMQTATHFKNLASSISLYWLTPCEPSEQGAMPMTYMQVPADIVKEPAVSQRDIATAIIRAKPSVSDEDLQKYEEWTKKYGMEGA